MGRCHQVLGQKKRQRSVPSPCAFSCKVLALAGLCEAWIRKPRVKDFEDLAKDTDSLKGFWHNRVTHILLVVVLTNLTASIGSILAGIDIIKSFLGII